MKQKLLDFSKIFLPFSLILFVVHFITNQIFFEEIIFYYSIWGIYAFHITSTFLIYFLLVYVYLNLSDKTGFAFMGASLFKMLAAVLFLLPMLINNENSPFINLLSFFIPYFLYLILETIFAVKLINSR
ncbi:DUF6168 family protein [Gillisia sp. JM1]|jgi:hypothetical protein|uniref:DUF6168 family protein n=1 Tax=Gillisia sp. JM1 TaxID=1283286 RepID=UPI00047EA4E6|nr:DUF6168 family protein [Gillisia sp. JM1]